MRRGAGEGSRLIRAQRLRSQGLVPGVTRWDTAADVARGMVAMQAQDFNGVLYALSLRARARPPAEQVSAAFAAREVVRNRPSRGTLQVTAPEDLHWLSALLSPRSNAAAVKRREQLALTESTVQAVGAILREELAGGTVRTRPELVAACATHGVELDPQQAGHVLRHHTEIMTIVFAEPRGKQDTFALAEEWIGERREPDRAAALTELAIRYFSARGPATPQCLAWWANLAMGDVRTAIAGAGSALEEIEIDDSSFLVAAGDAALDDGEVDEALAEPLLLPPFDEYLLGYRSRDAVITPEHLDAVVPGRNGMFKPLIVVDGEVVGLWSRTMTARKVTVTLEPFGKLAARARAGLARRVDEYGKFHGRAATMEVAS